MAVFSVTLTNAQATRIAAAFSVPDGAGGLKPATAAEVQAQIAGWLQDRVRAYETAKAAEASKPPAEAPWTGT